VSNGVVFVAELAALSKNQQKHLAFLVSRAEKGNVRLVSFTAEEPTRLVEAQGFDAALMQMLSGIVIALPPLREHPEDIPEIAGLMLAQLVETRFCPPRIFSTGTLNVLRNFHGRGIWKTSPPPCARSRSPASRKKSGRRRRAGAAAVREARGGGGGLVRPAAARGARGVRADLFRAPPRAGERIH